MAMPLPGYKISILFPIALSVFLEKVEFVSRHWDIREGISQPISHSRLSGTSSLLSSLPTSIAIFFPFLHAIGRPVPEYLHFVSAPIT
jgi:hypothetical protein